MEHKLIISGLKDREKSATLFWLEKAPSERFEALEELRQRFFGYDETTQGFQRIITYLKR